MSATESLNGRKKMAPRKVENGIFFPARLDFPFPQLSAKQALFFRVFQAKQARSARHGRWGHPHPRPCLSLHYRFVLRSTYSVGRLRFLSHMTWKIVGKFRRYFTCFPGCQSSAPNMPRQRRETVAERRGLSKCLKEHPHNGWFT